MEGKELKKVKETIPFLHAMQSISEGQEEQ